MLELSGVFFLYHLFLFCAFSVNSSCSDLPSLISMSSTQFWLLLSVLHPRNIPVVIKARVTVKLILFSIFQSLPCFTALYPMCWIRDSCFIFLPSFLFQVGGKIWSVFPSYSEAKYLTNISFQTSCLAGQITSCWEHWLAAILLFVTDNCELLPLGC